MKKQFLTIIFALALFGCATTQKKEYGNTISSLIVAVDTSYKAYNDLVVTQKISPDNLTTISSAYNAFQQAAQIAIITAQYNTNKAFPTQELIEKSSNLLLLVNKATTKK